MRGAGGTAPFSCLRATEPDRYAVPVLTVLPLLTGEHLEEGEWVEKTRVQTSGSGRPPEVFFCLVADFSTCSVWRVLNAFSY